MYIVRFISKYNLFPNGRFLLNKKRRAATALFCFCVFQLLRVGKKLF